MSTHSHRPTHHKPEAAAKPSTWDEPAVMEHPATEPATEPAEVKSAEVKPAAEEPSTKHETDQGPNMVTVKCISDRRPWTYERHLEFDEEALIRDDLANEMVAEGQVELVSPPEPPPEARKAAR